jgi:hypothetical protein
MLGELKPVYFLGHKQGHYQTKGPFVMFQGHFGVPMEEKLQR